MFEETSAATLNLRAGTADLVSSISDFAGLAADGTQRGALPSAA
jgi:hypothetical protein